MRTRGAALLLLLLTACVLAGADPDSMEPVRICEVLEKPEVFAGKTVFLVGRYSYRERGLFLGEAACGAEKAAVLELVYDAKAGPKTPERLAVYSASLKRKLAAVKESTSLGKFRFGSQEYDRWALAFGRIELEPQEQPVAQNARQQEFRVPGRLVCRGAGLVLFLTEP